MSGTEKLNLKLERFNRLEAKYENQSKKLDNVELKNRNLEEKVTKLETTVANHRTEIDQLNSRIEEKEYDCNSKRNSPEVNAKSGRVKRPVRMLPAYVFNRYYYA